MSGMVTESVVTVRIAHRVVTQIAIGIRVALFSLATALIAMDVAVGTVALVAAVAWWQLMEGAQS